MAAVLAATPVVAQTPPVSYFPSAMLQPAPCNSPILPGAMAPITAVENEWFSKQLSAAGEPSLSTSADAGVSGQRLRFTWLRSFHAPIVVRIDGIGTPAPRLIAKQMSGEGGYQAGVIAQSLDRPLSEQEKTELAAALAKAGIARLAPKECSLGADGARWLVELVDDQGYHLVNRWSPKTGEVRDLGLFMLGLTGWNPQPVY